ncbi:uncharacterized protein LOC133200529 [Saccostrea echinata]|uniref:uncharacterized protein LOC133200529 n=1 Tax=Saccostrea echinata TaxID=191078 RepID=UPI002A820B63|nr:uncharacterized protein LOC133200529 [Saccostrea echinata]
MTDERPTGKHKKVARKNDTEERMSKQVDFETTDTLINEGTIEIQETETRNKPEKREHGDKEAVVNDTITESESERSSIRSIDSVTETVGIQETNISGEPKAEEQSDKEDVIIEITTGPESERSSTPSIDFDTTFKAYSLGDYNLWKTKVSGKFSTLTDDEVSVLFCFLCSDSGPPDFTDTEWLDKLNKIRQDVYGKENPVTSEEAQQTLDRLKSRDYLWEDQDKITDTKDETMYRIASINRDIPFYYSSYNTASVYLRSSGYNRKPKEKCVISDGYCDSSLIRRLHLNILTHVTMEDTDIYNEIYQILNIPEHNVKSNRDEREEFLMELRERREAVHYRGRSQDSVDHVTWLWRYGFDARPDIVRSCIGLHPHWDIYIIDNKACNKPTKYHNFPPEVRCLLYCLLLTEKYQLNLNEQSHRITRDKIRDRYFTDITDDGLVDLPDGITETHNGVTTFMSDDIRHDAMYAFVTECLVEDSDQEFFLTTASRDVISEYCRSWEYKRSEGERCLYVPDKPKKMYDLFIDKLQLDIITHCTVSDGGIHDSISKRLKIPREILYWDIDARKRFVQISSQDSVNMCRARGMIVGCTGAGKTTLLRRLQTKNKEESIQPTETTVGLDIHEDLFEIKDDTLIDFDKNGTKSDRTSNSTSGKQLISMTDFAGQIAYYACHQIYLSRRAFYLVVVDMSKRLNEKAILYDTDRHNPLGSLFHKWTFADYFVFWLQSIKTYCEDGTSKESQSDETKANPVILIASHHDCLGQRKQTTSNETAFYDTLEKCLPKEHTLNDHISPARYFEIECPRGKLNEHQEESIEQVRKCIVHTATSLPHWGEKIPHIWYMFEQFVQEHKIKRICSRESLQAEKEFNFLDENELDDMLRYFSEVGQIIYFSEMGLSHNIILDVEWFVGAFRNIITDPTHARPACRRVKEWEIFMKNGIISDSTLVKIWRENKKESYVLQKDNIVPYMEKLGIVAKMKSQEVEEEDDEASGKRQESLYYIPSINKTDFTTEGFDLYNNGNKTPILVFSFKTFIPHFFFFRLVAICFSKWEFLSQDWLCKNVAFYKEKGDDIYIAIAVNKTSIQLQAFTPEDKIKLTSADTKQIRVQIEYMLGELTTTFHHQVLYEVGYACEDINITEEDEDCFLPERTVAELKTNERVCPNFRKMDHRKHQIVRDDLLHYWYTGAVSSDLFS